MGFNLVHSAQCVCCGQVVTFVTSSLYAGWYPCPKCEDLGIVIPVTTLTPECPDGFELVDFLKVELHRDFLAAVRDRSQRLSLE